MQLTIKHIEDYEDGQQYGIYLEDKCLGEFFTTGASLTYFDIANFIEYDLLTIESNGVISNDKPRAIV